jgi:cyanophycin synthetase
MNWPGVRVLRGPNVWAPNPMLEVELDLNGTAADAAGVESAARRLRAALPEFGETGARGDPALSLAWGLVRLTVALQRLAGSPVAAGVVRPARPGVFGIAVEFEAEALGSASLETARRLWLAALAGSNLDVQADLASLRELALEVRLGPSTEAIVAAAKRQGVPAFRLNDGNLIQLGHGAHRRRIWTAETDRTGAIAEAIARDKDQTRYLLRGVGVPVPEGRPVRDAEDAWAAAEEIGPPVVVKPRHGNHGRGVTTGLLTREQVERAFAAAREHGDEVIVERFVPGRDFRLLVVGGQVAAAALREPPEVVGDGRSTVAELVAALNRDPRRSDGHGTALSVVKLDAIALDVLAEQGLAPDPVPAEGRRVLVRRNANLSSGGTATDVTDEVHPRAAATAVAAASAVGLDIAGVDVVAPAIDQPLERSGGVVVEVNAGPGLRMHLGPSAGTPRPVGDAIVRMLFPAGATARVPLAAVTGINGSTTARLLAHLLTGAGHLVGLACEGGLYVGGRQIDSRDGTGAQSAWALLLNPRVTAAVLEVAPGRALREGLGFDLCDVAVVTQVGRGVDLPGEDSLIESIVARAITSAGAAVLNAADPLVAAMASACPGPVLYFARAESETVREHLAQNARAVLVREGRLVLAQGPAEEVLLPLGELRPRHGAQGGFDVEDVLAAAGAAWALGLPGETIHAGLATFLMEG